ncbi:tyrosine-protein phosphatase [Microbacterium sp. M1A1_1b]
MSDAANTLASRTADERSAAVSGTFNLRDLGGLRTTDGRTVVTGRLFRSGSLAGLDNQGRGQLDALGVRSVIDLRSDAERLAAPDALVGSAVRATAIPMLAGAASTMTTVPTVSELYRHLLDDEPAAVAEAVRRVARDEPGVLVHCSAGKDRTGVVIALVLLAVGVDPEDVLDDYQATERFLPDTFGATASAMVRAAHEQGMDVDDEAVQQIATRSPRTAMQAAIAHLTERWGSATGALRAAGLSDDDLTALRDRLLD